MVSKRAPAPAVRARFARTPLHRYHALTTSADRSPEVALTDHDRRSLTYGAYLELDRLLGLQAPRDDGPEHDEMLFIVVHQVYELWFKVVLHELDHLCDRLGAGDGIGAERTLRRVLTILKTLVAQVDVLETMTPREFLSFRDRLESASGFQSWQFRAVEMTLGAKDAEVPRRFPAGTEARRALEERLASPSLWQVFLRYLGDRDYAVPTDALARPADLSTEAHPKVQALLLDIYREAEADPRNNLTLSLCERLVDLDEGLQEWRYRHVRMVERTIGSKSGTGGSSGVTYLRSTLFRPMFPDLWAIRADL